MSIHNVYDLESDSDGEQVTPDVFDELMQQAKDGKWTMTEGTNAKDESELRNEFLREHRDTVHKVSTDGRTIFHHLVPKDSKKNPGKLTHIMRWSVQIAGVNLAKRDKENKQTAFHLAFEYKKFNILQCMLDAYAELPGEWRKENQQCLDDIITIENEYSDTVLHLAILRLTPCKSDADQKIVKTLIKNAKKDTLRKMNHKKLTALHLAVEWDRCNEQQVDIVKLLLKGCREALTMSADAGSVYLHHRMTRPSSGVSTLALKPSKGASKARKGQNPNHTTQNMLSQLSQTESKKYDVMAKDESKDKAKDKEDGADNNIAGDVGLVANAKSQPAKNSKSSAAGQKAAKAVSFPIEPSDDYVLEIEKLLKHTFLRYGKREKAQSFLYGDKLNEWKQIFFNLKGKEGEIDMNNFKASYDCVKLEDTLTLVHIPQIVIKPDATSTLTQDNEVKEQTAIKPLRSALGRTDLHHIFTWLRDKQKVKKIFQLIVEDSHHPPHTDATIETSVHHFDVEIWDWRKVDLCVETIKQAAPNVREMKLYWSGRNAVLRGWSESIPNLTKLEKITVQLLPDSIEGDRNTTNFTWFKNKIEEQCANRPEEKRILVDNLERPSPGLNRNSASKPSNDDQNAAQGNQWLDCMKEFCQFIAQTTRLFDDEQNLKPRTPIRIAVIDDGIDRSDKALHSCVNDGFSDHSSPSWFVSANRHGTTMASIIAKVFPNAAIVSYKLDEREQWGNRLQFSTQSATKAIKWAKDYGVSIINMSWSIHKKGKVYDNDDLSDLNKAIAEAKQTNIIILCASSDQGQGEDTSFPAKSSNVIKIGAATSLGGKCDYVGKDNVDFLFPGRIVWKEQNSPAGEVPKDRSEEGSSIATAFATGLAGLILHMLHLTDLCFDSAREQDKAGEFRPADYTKRIREVFEAMMNTERFVDVRTSFGGVADKVPTGGRLDERLNILKELCKSWPQK